MALRPQIGNNDMDRQHSGFFLRSCQGNKLSCLLLYLLLLFSNHFGCDAEAENIPLGVVFEQGSAEVQTAFKVALMRNTPFNITNRTSDMIKSFGFNAYVDTINTADAFKLSKLICNQFFRGVYAMVGSMNAESFETIHSYANTFEMPIITPWFPTRPVKVSKFKVKQSLHENPAMSLELNSDNKSSSVTRSPLINDTFQKELDAVESNATARGQLLERLIEETVAKEREKTDFATRIRPDLHRAILDTMSHYGWTNIIYMYTSNEGLLRLQSIFQNLGFKNDSVRVSALRKISDAKDAISVLRNLEVAQRFEPKHIVLDCPINLAKDIIVSHVRDVHLGRRTYHYLVAGLAFDEPWEKSVVEFSAVNVTGFRMVDPDRKYVTDFLTQWVGLDSRQFEGAGRRAISANAAFMYDGMLVIKEAFSLVVRDFPDLLRKNATTKFTCNTGSDFLNYRVNPFQHGRLINSYLRKVQAEGLTGHIEFHEGTRSNFSVDVMETTLHGGAKKVGQWSDIYGFTTGTPKFPRVKSKGGPDPNKVYIVTSILEEPYLVLKKAEKGENLTGNDMFEGFCKDMADLIAKNMNIKYEIKLVKDKKYGAENPSAPGGWDGMIGELIRHEADIVVAPLTITAARETVVDFSMDFMELGISIMIKKPQTAMPGAFSFVKPMQRAVWVAALAALIGVSVVLLIVTRKPHNTDVYNFQNTLWYTIASIFRQSTPGVSPRTSTKGTTGGRMLMVMVDYKRLFHFIQEADIAIASLTITAERERVIDFTKPYLNLGISIMIYKPKKANSGVFGFMSPLSMHTWYCVILAYLGVSVVLYFVTRFNETEWVPDRPGTMVHQFSVPNALWFSLAALFQQGSDISPRSLAGRVVGSVWWFFTLILISSYTANFAAVRTVNRMILPIKSAKDLSEQTDIQFGTLLGGSTFEFFRRSEVPVYKRMFEFMSGPNQLNVQSYADGIKLVREKKGKYALLIESPKNDYTNQRKPCDTMKVGPNLDSKGFGIGTPLGSHLKHRINLEVLRLKENGILTKLENKWWFERSECDVTNKQETATGDEELSLGSLAGIFYILIIGLVVAMLVALFEFCYDSKNEAQKSKLSLTEAMKKKARSTIAGHGISTPRR